MVRVRTSIRAEQRKPFVVLVTLFVQTHPWRHPQAGKAISAQWSRYGLKPPSFLLTKFTAPEYRWGRRPATLTSNLSIRFEYLRIFVFSTTPF